MSFSVLISLYKKENPKFLEQSLDSIFKQTLRANECVLVEDGPLTKELYDVVKRYQKNFSELKIVKLEKNRGLGEALNEGLRYCNYDLIVRADTDDICKSDRFEKQVRFMENHPEIDVCSSGIDEFEDSIENVISTRSLPCTHEELYHFGKHRNPINHPASIFRKRAVEAVGSYQHFYLFEDYYLWARMLVNGAKFHNLQESLLYFRSSPEMIKRRGGWKYAWVELKFQITIYRIGYINLITMLGNLLIRFGVRIMPNSMRKIVYFKLLRKQAY